MSFLPRNNNVVSTSCLHLCAAWSKIQLKITVFIRLFWVWNLTCLKSNHIAHCFRSSYLLEKNIVLKVLFFSSNIWKGPNHTGVTECVTSSAQTHWKNSWSCQCTAHSIIACTSKTPWTFPQCGSVFGFRSWCSCVRNTWHPQTWFLLGNVRVCKVKCCAARPRHMWIWEINVLVRLFASSSPSSSGQTRLAQWRRTWFRPKTAFAAANLSGHNRVVDLSQFFVALNVYTGLISQIECPFMQSNGSSLLTQSGSELQFEFHSITDSCLI